MAELSRARSLTYMQDPNAWGRRPYLPLVKRGVVGMPGCGFLFDGQGATVFMGNIFMITPKPLVDMERKQYPSFEAVLDDGWEVD